MKFLWFFVKGFAVLFLLSLLFSIGTAPVIFGVVFLTATAVGGCIIYGAIGGVVWVIANLVKSVRMRKNSGD
jgi:hypothetical protein